ncbi:MAG TPA: DUF1684 domain-containing protein [Acidobacteriaceae bacterium]|jgi:hypothetical protein|nr:DUF1684 domain-containing protein [Acidobacteriaceae bacterium]
MAATSQRICLIVVSITTALLTLTALAAKTADWQGDLLAWRAQRAQSLSAPEGWLTLVALDWLRPGDNSFGAAADNRIRLDSPVAAHLGVLNLTGNQVRLVAPQRGFPSTLLVDGKPAHATSLAGDDARPTVMTAGTLTLIVIHRGDRYALRVKDSNAPTRVNFHGLHWFDPNPHFRVEARWIPWVPQHQEKIPTILGTTVEMPAPGLAEFTLDGQTIQLEPVLEEPGARQLFFIVRDTTSHTASYGAGRFLYADFPDHGLDHPGRIVLDFNRLQNPPCAYTPYATCPLPPARNRLSLALPAGEERYSH